MSDALGRLCAAADAPETEAAAFRERGGRVVWTLGWDIPRELVDACGLHPVRLVPDERDSSAIDALVGTETIGRRGRALLAAIAELPSGDALLISHADAEQPQLFATLRELARCGVMALPPVHFLDLLTIDRPSTRRYNRVRVEQTLAWLTALGGKAPDLGSAITQGNGIRDILSLALSHRISGQLSGAEAHRLLAAAAILSPETLEALLPAATAQLSARPAGRGAPVLLSGSEIERIAVIDAIERDAQIVGENHGWGAERLSRRLDATIDPLDAFAAATLTPTAGPFASIAMRGDRLAEQATRLSPERVLHLRFAGEDGTAWEAAALRRSVAHLPFLSASWPDESARVAAFLRGEIIADGSTAAASVEPAKRASVPAAPARSRKSLQVVSRFGAYQREWFQATREQALGGRTFAVVNANAPQEMLRTLDIPFVVNQWWASIVAAKQQSARYAVLLAEHGLPPTAEAYSSQGVAANFDTDAALAPWGGLPKPDVVAAVLSTDATPKLFETWASATGARLQQFERSIESRWEIPIDWWDGLAENWDTLLEPERLDLFEAELQEVIAELEQMSGSRFDPARFTEVMNLVNEQETWYRRTRDLVAATIPAPISVVDQMPATMVPQWHRGTVWARDAAKAFHDEVAERVAAGEGACRDERLRLMFVGRGVWGDMGFYQRWEESHGAVFVCSMYLSLAADGYIRHHDRGRDPVRALAARFVTMGDELRMPTWAGAWHVREAQLHQVDGAMALSDADPLVLRALREAGVPVLELGMDNYVRAPDAEADLDRRVAAFLEGPVAMYRQRRA